ncbi:MAG: hypothetical protein FJ293_04440, partial [Planctomycetes bacterium]|nr:hypothetical protein [Planctomycetota bacterium]
MSAPVAVAPTEPEVAPTEPEAAPVAAEVARPAPADATSKAPAEVAEESSPPVTSAGSAPAGASGSVTTPRGGDGSAGGAWPDGLAPFSAAAAAAAGLADFAAVLSMSADEWGFSGDALAPWIVFARRDAAPPLSALAAARARLEQSLFTPESWRALAATPLLLIAGSDEPALAARARRWPGAVQVIEAAAPSAHWIEVAAELALTAGWPKAPRWWSSGAAAWLAAAESATAL